MTRNEILAVLRELIRRQERVKLDAGEITEQTKVGDVGFDSLTILEFMYDVEHRLQVEIQVSDLVEMKVVADLIDYLQGKLVA